MPKKSAKKSAAKDKPKLTRPTRCPPGFEWQERPSLIEATDKNDVYSVKRLIARGADPNEALHHAIGRGKFEITQVLLEAGADIHTEIRTGDYWIPPIAPPAVEKVLSPRLLVS